tara:strand:- start:98 stop:1015 length:918 start_codon:yes stop_codon:yes gene_type:complete
MTKQDIKKKYLFLGDIDSINIELVLKSFGILKNKVNYILICNKKDLLRSNYFKRKKIEINEILDPISFLNYKKNKLNVFNINNISKKKYLNLLNQIQISNNLANKTKYDLVTMPIDKSIFKKKINFTGLTEYFGNINKKTTIMLMHGDNFSVIPITTHINLKNVSKHLSSRNIEFFIKNIFNNLKRKIYNLNFTDIKFLCYNPHCGEDNTLGNEDIMIKKIIKKKKRIKGIFSADSIFINFKISTLFISTYHDQALIPFKILNKKSLNLTLGLNYRRLSPAHGVARDIKKKYIADNTSYLKCLLF